MKKLLLLLANGSVKGFTLIELLLASIMTFFVVSATGYAIIVMTRENLASDVSSDLRFNTDRAADFIADEIKQASFISINSAILPTGCPTLGTGEQFVLGLAIAPSTTVNVVYYTKTPPGGIWRRPSSIYRCGLGLGTNGYTNSINTTPSILVDSILIPDSSATPPITIPACTSGTRFPGTPTAGFYICHPPDLPTGTPDQRLSLSAERIVELNVRAASTELAGRGMTTGGTTGRFDSKAVYSVTTKVFARSGNP